MRKEAGESGTSSQQTSRTMEGRRQGAEKRYLGASEEYCILLLLSLTASVQIPVQPLTTLWLWASCSNSKCLNFLICKM